jgi:pimeloyl-ACP methyl ester carboxylesterase
METAVMRYNRTRVEALGWTVMGLLSTLSRAPGSLGRWAARRLMAQVWKNYFPDPAAAPAADRRWLAGVSGKAMIRTRKAILDAGPEALAVVPNETTIPALVLFGGRDIYGAEAQTLLARFPMARHVRLDASGHLPWLQDRVAFAEVLEDFYGSMP